MGPKWNESGGSASAAAVKRQERETRRQEKKNRQKESYLKEDENARAFEEQLRTFNLQLRDIPGDGNCLFRSFADQMEGTQHRHKYYRLQICEFIERNRNDFEPFIVDQSFEAFLRSMSKDGTYGGNECLVAFSRLYDARICIHQLNQPVWTVCFSDAPKHEIHISYHNYEHYSSVRRLGDDTSTSANIRQQMTSCDPSSISRKPAKSATQQEELFHEYDVDYIESQLTRPVDRQLIRDTLTDNRGDINATLCSLYALEETATINENTTVMTTNDENIDDDQAIVQAFIQLNTNDDVEELQINQEGSSEAKKKNSQKTKTNRQILIDKKKAKKQRATERHRTQILSTTQSESKKSEETRPVVNAVNDEQAPLILANMEFIQI